MPIYRLTADCLAPVAPVTYTDACLTERGDLQRLLRDQIDVLGSPDDPLLVISEEFADWEDSARRIDLLAVDRQANLVVIELKVTEDAGHADLQALRYAAMVSAMTFEQAVEAYHAYRQKRGRGGDAREQLNTFLSWATPDETRRFASDVRIVLVAPGFSKELTTMVLWLRDRGLDVRCVRILPHRLDDGTPAGVLLADVEQLIPLREAEEFQVRLSRKVQQERAAERVPAPDMDEMRRRLEEGRSPAERAAIDTVIRRLEELGAEWFANPGSLAQRLYVPGKRRPHYLFAFRPGEGVEVWFRWLAARAPFSDVALRRELLVRLNAVPGIAIAEDRLDKMPKFPLAVLADRAACAAFCDVWTWAVGVLRAES